MTWHWFSFLIGAPVWASIGIALFAALLAANHERGVGRTVGRFDGEAGADEHVISLEEYKRRRAQLRPPARSSGAQTRP